MMKTYLITVPSNMDESIISSIIKKYHKWAQISQSAYLVQSNKKAAEIRNDILNVFAKVNDDSVPGKDDLSAESTMLLVIRVTSEWATSCVDKEVTKWMHDNI